MGQQVFGRLEVPVADVHIDVLDQKGTQPIGEVDAELLGQKLTSVGRAITQIPFYVQGIINPTGAPSESMTAHRGCGQLVFAFHNTAPCSAIRSDQGVDSAT